MMPMMPRAPFWIIPLRMIRSKRVLPTCPCDILVGLLMLGHFERLGGQYRGACGEQLVITSLTRPATLQPRNASERSVHPTGMALDIRYSWDRSCRRWLEGEVSKVPEGLHACERWRVHVVIQRRRECGE